MRESRAPARRSILVATVAFIFVALAAPSAAAQSDPFESLLEGYLMGAGMSGTVGIGPVATDIDVPSSEIFNNLKFAALLDYRGQAPKWAVQGDVVYMNLGGSGDGPAGKGSVDVGTEELIVDVIGAYRFSKAFEAIAGLRYTNLRTTLKVYAPNAYREGSVSQGWVDPIVGAQAFLPLGEAFQLQMRGDIGGFGVGSDFTWAVTVRVNWRASRALRLGLGYRWLDQDYKTGSGSDFFQWKVMSQGPLAAVAIAF